MSADWEKVDTAEFLRDVHRANNEAYKMTPHPWTKRKRLPWVVCCGCGLVSLRNPLTAWAEKHGCSYKRHPDYAQRVG